MTYTPTTANFHVEYLSALCFVWEKKLIVRNFLPMTGKYLRTVVFPGCGSHCGIWYGH